jgi:hypothetical protein
LIDSLLLANSALDLTFPFALTTGAAALVAALSALVTTAGFNLASFFSSISLVKLELSSATFFLLLDSPTLRLLFLAADYLVGAGSLSESNSAMLRFLKLVLTFTGLITSSESESSIIFLALFEAGLRLVKPMSSSSLDASFISTSSGTDFLGD